MHNLWTLEIVLKINKCHHWFGHVGTKSVCSQCSNKNKIPLRIITASAFHDKNDFKALNLLLTTPTSMESVMQAGNWKTVCIRMADQAVFYFWQQKVWRFLEMQACPDHWKKFSGETRVRKEKMTQWHSINKSESTKKKVRNSWPLKRKVQVKCLWWGIAKAPTYCAF